MEEKIQHDRITSDLWSQFNDDRRLNLDTRERVSSIEAKLDSLISAIQDIGGKVNEKRETNWFGLGALILALFTASGTYINTRLSPTEHQVQIISEIYREQIADTARLQERAIINEGLILRNLEHINTLNHDKVEFNTRLGRIEGQVQK